MILDKVRNTIKRFNLISKGDKILVGVSGGPDSVTLLFVLNSLKKELNLTLHIAHLDHMLRKDSFKDSIFVCDLAGELKLPVTRAQINVKELARRGSLEEIARNARIGFLLSLAKKTKATKIALGHNLDDQAETVLMRLLRGSGLYGLAGILPKRKFGDVEIIRPLIEVRRKDIEMFLKRKSIKPRIDTSNFQDIYFRNKVRNKLIPLLEKEYNRNIKKILSNTAESLGYDYNYLNRESLKIAKEMNLKINLKKFSRLHPAIQRLVLRLNIKRLKGDTRSITFQHIKEIEDLIFNRPVNSVVDLPKAISVIKKKRNLYFFRKAKRLAC
jgi:tRNA(Ile)-lysidine synthase